MAATFSHECQADSITTLTHTRTHAAEEIQGDNKTRNIRLKFDGSFIRVTTESGRDLRRISVLNFKASVSSAVKTAVSKLARSSTQ